MSTQSSSVSTNNSQALLKGEGMLKQKQTASPFMKNLKIRSIRLAILVSFIIIWETVSGRLVDKFWISSPIDIVSTLYKWATSGDLFFHLSITLQETFIGFFLGAFGGIFVGFILGRWAFAAQVLDPFITAIYSLPKIALAPLFILWFGIGIEMKIIFAGMIVFFLVFFNTYAGVKDVDDDLLDDIRLMGANKRQIMLKVILPSAMTWVFVGLKLSVPYALVGAVVGEIVASNKGIGFLIQYSAGNFDTAGTFAALTILIIVSVSLNATLSILESKLLRWKKTNSV
ncbi:ABC transporter permease [Psychrobacillus sp. OK032]|uniref:ABC transporter permease n=1 Tax=Psychrobacillus sp. OK032 TaxID=1884358 RepID=UPI0008D55ACF|nr:ABC transporter permease [Psychrobacillus sp. OK032]SES00656.1 NitT/TauT family transport system permease protein [Psychrobacillus sp. OK032]